LSRCTYKFVAHPLQIVDFTFFIAYAINNVKYTDVQAGIFAFIGFKKNLQKNSLIIILFHKRAGKSQWIKILKNVFAG